GADVGVVQVAVDVVVGDVAVEAAADRVGQLAEGPDVRGVVEDLALIDGETLAGEDPGRDQLKAGIASQGRPRPPLAGPARRPSFSRRECHGPPNFQFGLKLPEDASRPGLASPPRWPGAAPAQGAGWPPAGGAGTPPGAGPDPAERGGLRR